MYASANVGSNLIASVCDRSAPERREVRGAHAVSEMQKNSYTGFIKMRIDARNICEHAHIRIHAYIPQTMQTIKLQSHLGGAVTAEGTHTSAIVDIFTLAYVICVAYLGICSCARRAAGHLVCLCPLCIWCRSATRLADNAQQPSATLHKPRLHVKAKDVHTSTILAR